MKKGFKFLFAMLLPLSASSCVDLGGLNNVTTGFELLKESTWTQISNVNELSSGDRLIFAYGNKAMGHYSEGNYPGVQTTFGSITISDQIAQFELGGSQGNWTFKIGRASCRERV